MKLIIDIDEDLKSAIYNCGLFLSPTDKITLINAINNGTPLPKGHGRLIDESKIRTINHYHTEKCLVGNFYHDLMFDVETDAPTIIEADKGEQK